jgi:S1-C subfamily serine protease
MSSHSRLANFLSALLGGLVVAVLVAALAIGGAFDDDDGGAAPTAVADSNRAAASDEAPAPAQNATDVSELYDRVRGGVVYVEVRSAQQTPFGPQEGAGSGSGFVLDREGHILTNQHVVSDAERVRVRIGDSRDLVDARVMGTDPSSDLAVVKVDPKEAGRLQPLELGSSQAVDVGDPAIAIGSPFGLEGTLTTGVISAQNRPIIAPNNFTIEGALQTDAAINPGNSGGPLLDGAGRVIGINAQIAANASRTNSGVGFAIPVDTAKEVIPKLQRGEEIRRPFLGVTTTEADEGTGAVVAEVTRGGPAQRAGLRPGDRIVSVAGQQVREATDVAAAISDKRVGERVEVVVQRRGERETLQVELGARPRQAPR